MTWMNEYEVEEVAARLTEETPNLHRGSRILVRLVNYTNRSSDGWPYWQKPARAAGKLMDHLHAAERWDPTDITEAQLKQALSPIKAFLTKQGVEHALILEDPPPPPPPPPAPLDRDELRAMVQAALNSGKGDTEWATLVDLGGILGLEYDEEKDTYQ